MTDDAMQGLLFGSSHDVVSDDVATREVRLLTLNVQGSPATRRDDILEWLYGTEHNVLVLTEVRVNDSGNRLIQELESSGFQAVRVPAGPDDRYRSVIATKGYEVQPVKTNVSTPRLAIARLATHFGPLDVVGLYSVTNGMSVDSSTARREFQQRILETLTEHRTAHSGTPLLITGDLNVLEPGHQPATDDFEEHDYAFYSGLLDLGLVDAYRHIHPKGVDLSWYGPLGGQRLDHMLIDESLAHRLADCVYTHSVRTRRISDHSAMTVLLK
ncbi:endonuclease/exonuclease/phosphatase family protein [Streptomyces europaeiscabiei]|uniref:endonuclease/exonuclease/phosphatase family protein n=1 Tax=Streptomyces europaeiscabiei TaxID=146819 RepID=UPI002E193FC4